MNVETKKAVKFILSFVVFVLLAIGGSIYFVSHHLSQWWHEGETPMVVTHPTGRMMIVSESTVQRNQLLFRFMVFRDSATGQEFICTNSVGSCWLTGRRIDEKGVEIK